jgi:glycerol-3-phosphate dehydrogenase
MFAIPWENRTMIGTTDLDHPAVDDETRISQSELDYLIEATQHAFPGDPVSENDIISTFSGLRPVINTNAETPSKESRAHKIWEENGLVTIAGGKLTIFRVMAADVLNFCSDRLPNNPRFNYKAPCFIHPKPSSRHQSSDPDWLLMAGRLGQDVNSFFQKADPNFMKPIHPMTSFWAELAWAAEHEAVVHLDDLLLRRVRLGLLLPRGGMDHIEHVRDLVQRPLGWTDETWEIELERYKEIWQEYYSLPRK